MQKLWDDVKKTLLEALEKDNLIQLAISDDWGSGGWNGVEGGTAEDSTTSWEYEGGAEIGADIQMCNLEDDEEYFYNAGKAMQWEGEESNLRGF